MEINALVFDVYANIIRRLRWLFLAVITLSSSLIIHTYLENYSFSDSQLIQVIANRIELNTMKTMAEIEKELKKDRNTGTNEYKEKLAKFAEKKYIVKLTDNTMNSVKMENRTVPFLGISILANDFLPVISIILVIFMLATSATLKSVCGPLSLLDLSDSNIRKVTQIHFLFFNDPESEDHRLSKLLMHATVWLSPLALVLAIGFDIYPVIREMILGDGYAIGTGEMLISRYSFLALLLLAISICSFSCTKNLTGVHKIFQDYKSS